MGLCLFDVEMPNNGDMVEISDSDSDSDVVPSKLSAKTYSTKSKCKRKINTGPVLDPKEIEYLTKNLDEGFNGTWTNFKMPEQLAMCENTLNIEMDMLNGNYALFLP